jgi:hypothetical protein
MDPKSDRLRIRLALLREIASTEQRLGRLYAQLSGPTVRFGDDPDARPREVIQQAIEITARSYGLEPKLLLSRIRTQQVAEARHVVMWLLVQQAEMTTVAAGSATDRNHTAVSHGVQHVRDLMATDPVFAARVQQITEQFRDYCIQLLIPI